MSLTPGHSLMVICIWRSRFLFLFKRVAHDICVKAKNFKSNFIFYMKQVANKYDLSTDALRE
jgi:hypothetical protein